MRGGLPLRARVSTHGATGVVCISPSWSSCQPSLAASLASQPSSDSVLCFTGATVSRGVLHRRPAGGPGDLHLLVPALQQHGVLKSRAQQARGECIARRSAAGSLSRLTGLPDSTRPPAPPKVACSRKGLENNCPKKCRDERTHTCGNGCSAILVRVTHTVSPFFAFNYSRNVYPPHTHTHTITPQAQHLPKAKHSSCWSVGQWGEGTKVSVSLLDPSDPTQGIIYTMLQGDSKGCPNGVSRTLSLAVTCPGVGMPTVPVMVATSLGNCAYAATMQHPAACPITQDTLSARDQRLSFYRNTQGAGVGSTGEVFLHLFGAAISIFLMYMCAGAMWRYLQLGMRGVDVIPHMHVWKDLPDTVVRFGVAAADEVRTLMDPAHTGVPSEELDAQRGHSSASVPLLRRDA